MLWEAQPQKVSIKARAGVVSPLQRMWTKVLSTIKMNKREGITRMSMCLQVTGWAKRLCENDLVFPSCPLLLEALPFSKACALLPTLHQH